MLGQITKATVFRHSHVKGVHLHWDGGHSFHSWVDGKLQEEFMWADGKLRSVDEWMGDPSLGCKTPVPTPPQAEYIALSFFEEQGYR